MRDRDQRSPADRPFSRDAAGLQQQLMGRNNGFGGVKNIRGPRLLTVGEQPQRRLRSVAPPGFGT